MHRWTKAAGLAAAMLLALTAGAVAASQPAPASPQQLFGAFYAEVEQRSVFADSKTFADATPRRPPAEILAAWRAGGPWSVQALRRFVLANFDLPQPPTDTPPPTVAVAAPRLPLLAHIAALWPVLTRRTPTAPAYSSLLPLPGPYVVPGGRFRELYYWDSYFTMLGLVHDGRNDLVESMIDDFGSLLDRYGHIPNGTRSYYLSRSQPPLFYLMVGLSRGADRAVQARRLAWIRREHDWWMQGEAGLRAGQARDHVVAMPDGAILNRYHDALDTPRDESFREDVAAAQASGRPTAEIDADLRAGAESGWDYSSRWLADGRTLATIRTLDIAPVDLNALLYGQERAIAQGCAALGDLACARDFTRRAEARAAAMQRWLWDDRGGLYRDVLWRTGAQTPSVSAATLYPLFTGEAPASSAARVAARVRSDLLAPGGLRTTTVRTGQQWDEPNGWAPLQWIAVTGLRHYGQGALADDIACRWMSTIRRAYAASGRLLEKYDVEEIRPGGGGEYPLQDGFGWTNGVADALSTAQACRPSTPAK